MTKSLKISNESDLEAREQQFVYFLLYFGISIPLIEIVLQYFNVRQQSYLIVNIPVGIILITFYFLCTRTAFFAKRVNEVFIFCFFGYFSFVAFNVFYKEFELISFSSLIITFFLSYFVFKNVLHYWLFIVTLILLLFASYNLELIPKSQNIVLVCTLILTVTIHTSRHLALLDTKNQFTFANMVVNNGNSIILITNINGEISYCSQSIKEILGYEAKDILGMELWRIAEDKNYQNSSYTYTFVDGKLHVQKYKAKNGAYRYIQWNDKKYTDEMFIRIGQDVTEKIKIEHQYKNLIETASDLIFELNSNNEFTFVNSFTEKIVGYSKDELLGKKFFTIIRNDFIEQVTEFYAELPDGKTEFPDFIFPITSKSGQTVWLSQKVSILKNSDNKLIGYSVIARDITLIRNLEIEHYARASKITVHNEIIKDLTSKSYSNKDTFTATIKNILQTVSTKCNIDRVSYWYIIPEGLKCENLYHLSSNRFEKNFVIDKISHPTYFNHIENVSQIVASDVFSNPTTKELCNEYAPKNKVKSLLDTPIFINGKLLGILCFETVEETREWDNEDINFSRSIADLIGIAAETQARIVLEQKLTYEKDILFEIVKNSEGFLQSKDNDEIIKNILGSIGKVTNVEVLSYYICNNKSEQFEQKYRWEKQSNSLSELNPKILTVPYSILPTVTENLSNNQPYYSITRKITYPSTKKLFEDLNTKSILFLPIFVKDELHSTIVFIVFENEREWNNDEINTLQNLSNNISFAIERNLNEAIIKENEEKFRLLANNIPGVVYLSNNDEQYSKIYLNDQIEKLTGYSKSDFLNGKLFFHNLIHPDDRVSILNQQKKCITNNKPFHFTYRIIKKSGEIIWIEEFGDAVTKDGEITFIEGIFLDITERKTTETAIKDKEYAEAASKAKTEFLANMSHEIRTPLNGIIGFTELLKHTNLEKMQMKYMNTISQSANSLMEVINNILDFSKIESGKLELNIEKTKVSNLSSQVIQLIKLNALSKGIEIELNIDENVPKYIWIDYIRVKQILINLLSNAIKFTKKGKVTLYIKTHSIEDTKMNVVFGVKDTGIGIRKENQEKIFEAFSQEDSSTTKHFGGTGLGLAISNQLLSLMNSKLELSSKYGEGSDFSFDINVEYTNEKQIKETIKKETTDQVHSEKTILDNKLIYIAEDNSINMLLAKTLVQKIVPNATIIELKNGTEIVEVATGKLPDLILMDIQMPIMNGYQATAEIRKLSNSQHVPIIALTAGIVAGEKEKCLENGMNDYISKPIDKKILENIIHFWLSKIN